MENAGDDNTLMKVVIYDSMCCRSRDVTFYIGQSLRLMKLTIVSIPTKIYESAYIILDYLKCYVCVSSLPDALRLDAPQESGGGMRLAAPP